MSEPYSMRHHVVTICEECGKQLDGIYALPNGFHIICHECYGRLKGDSGQTVSSEERSKI